MNRYRKIEALRRGWQPPPELRHSPPRDVRLSGGGIFVAILGILLLLGAIAAAVFLGRESLRQQSDARLLQASGRESEGRVVRLWQRKGENKRGENKRTHVEYEFDFEGRTYRNESTIPTATWKRLQEGGPVRVTFAPSRPELNYPTGRSRNPPPVWVAILVSAGALLLASLCYWALRRQKELLAEGRPAPAIVTNLGKFQHAHGSSMATAHYEFPLLSGGIARGKSNLQSKVLTQDGVICILYDPGNPRRNSVYPLELVTVVRDA